MAATSPSACPTETAPAPGQVMKVVPRVRAMRTGAAMPPHVKVMSAVYSLPPAKERSSKMSPVSPSSEKTQALAGLTGKELLRPLTLAASSPSSTVSVQGRVAHSRKRRLSLGARVKVSDSAIPPGAVQV